MRHRIVRLLLLAAIIAIGTIAILWNVRRSRTEADAPRLAWVATARQYGPVGYRDPAGAISPDGKWIAYSEGRFLRVRPIEGGPSIELPPGEAQIRNLSWRPDNRTILADGNQTQAGWALYDIVARARRAFPIAGGGAAESVTLRSLVWSVDGERIAGIVNGPEGQELRILTPAGELVETRRIGSRIGFPAWTPRGEVACIATVDGRSRVTIPCGGAPLRTDPDLDAYGPIAFSPDGRTVYFGMPGGATLDLWAAPVAGGRARRLTSFSRDTYAPTVSGDGAVLFKLQNYRTVVASVPAEGGSVVRLAAFQSETPSWHPTGRWIGITYGTWRRVSDDAHYPDIAQDAGIIPGDASQPAAAPARIVHASPSEDQSLCWSPNGRWIAFHSHQDQSDDIWLRADSGDESRLRAEGASASQAARRITFLGRGAETGWPRWSPDGRWLLFSAASRSAHRTVIYSVGVDQDSGSVTSEAREVAIPDFHGDVTHAEWLPDGAHFVAIAKEGAGHHAILYLSREGGAPRIVRRFLSEHDAPGLAASPDGRDVAFIAPASDGFFQIFRMPAAGGQPTQVTADPSNKTQPAWSPDGRTLAFTVWSYDAQFFLLRR